MKQFYKIGLMLGLMILVIYASAQKQISDTNPVTIDFAGFQAAGFATSPSATQLDADDWATTGFSDGAKAFGVENTTGDHARGTTTSTTAGIYGVDRGSGNRALVIRPTGAEFNPGTLSLRFQNSTGSSISSIDFSYNIVVNNDQTRSNSWNFAYSTDNTTYSPVSALDYASTATASAGYTTVARSTTITGLNILDGEFFYVRWNSADISGSGSRDLLGVDDISLTATLAIDETPPTFITTYPNVSNITGNGVNLNVQLDEPGMTYGVVLPSGATPPTAAQVKAGTDASDAPVTLSGSFAITEASMTVSQKIEDLAGSTEYDLYLVAEDDETVPNVQANPTLVEFTTGPEDITAPVYQNSTPSVSGMTDTQFSLTVQLSEIGRAYYVLLANDANAPNNMQVKNGQDASGAAAFKSGFINITSADQDFSVNVTGLTANTPYDLYVVAEDDETTPNINGAPSSIDVTTTADEIAPTLISAATSAGASSSAVVLTFSENVSTTDFTGFTVEINDIAATITGISGTGTTQLTLTITEEIYGGQTVTVSYDDATGNIFDLADNASASFTDQAVTNNATTILVADLSELRSQATGSTVYRVAGELLVSHISGNSRDQRYVQDDGAGLLIDDNTPVIPSNALVAGDLISGLEGTITEFANTLQLVPTSVPTVLSSGNEITPITVTIADYNANPNTYESRFIRFEEVSFANAGTNFTTDQNVVLSDGVNNATLEAEDFTVPNLIGVTIPYGKVDLIALAYEDGINGPEVYARDANDFIDLYAPEFTAAPAATDVSYFSADITFTSNEPGTVYYLVLDNDAATPSNEDIITNGTPAAMTVGANILSITNLNDNTLYDVYVLAADDETNQNVQTSAVKLDVDTPELIFNADSDVTAGSSPIQAKDISSVDGAIIDVFNFTLTDTGSGDLSSTFVTGGVMVPGAANTADWMTTLAGVALQVGAFDPEGLFLEGEITEAGIFFDASLDPLELPDGQSVELTLYLILTGEATDGDVLQFEIPAVEGIIADGAQGSSFPATLPGGAVTSAAHTIQVVATALEVEGFEAAAIATDFELSVAAVDANGNVDTAARTISLSKATGTGTLSSVTGLSAQAMTDGEFTWTDLQVDLAGDYTFTADDDGSELTGTSGNVNIYEIVGDLFFSEYLEGSSNNKAIEIYNNLGGTADLSKYSVIRYNNGGVTPSATLVLSDIQPSLENGGVLVIGNASASATILAASDILSDITLYNGNDAMVLDNSGSVIDVIGQVGQNPGTAWTVGSTGSTAEKTLLRKNTITEGNPNGLGSFGTNDEDSEWLVYNQDDFNYIGFHVFGEQPFPLITLDATGFNGGFGYVVNGSSSDASSYSITTEDLSEDLVITPPLGFELSADEAFSGTIYTNASPWSITPTDGVVSQTVYVRFTPTAADGATYSGDISHTSTGADARTVAVSGVEGEAAVNSLSGVVINEVLYDPNGTYNYDTDGNGTADTPDEFVEIFNTSASPVDISGWQLWDEAASAFFTFPASTELGAGKYAAVMSTVQTGGTLPTGVDGNLTFSVASGMSLSNGGENVALRDPNSNTYVQVKYGATEADAAISGLSAATIVGIIESWGTAASGSSLVRSPEGSATIVNHADIQGAESASFAAPAIDPNAPLITVNSDGIHFGNLAIGVISETQTYTVSGINLAGDITITAPAGFEISANFVDWGTTFNLPPTDGVVEEITMWVRFTAESFGSKDGVITHASTDAFQIDLDVTGAGIEESTLYFETFACCDAGSFIDVSVTGAQEWRCATTGETGNGYLMSGFASGAQANEDWLIGSFDLTGYTGAELSFDSEFQFGGPALEVYASTDYAGNPATATWTILDAVLDENTAANSWTSSGDISLVPYVGGTVYIGFKYTSNTTDAPQWVLDNFLLTELVASFEVDVTNFNGAFGAVDVTTTSSASSFTVSGFELSGSTVTVTPPAQYQVSLASDFATFGTNANPLVINVTNGELSDVLVYVRFAPTATGAADGNITLSTDDYSDLTVAVTGTGQGFFNVMSTNFNGDFGQQDEGTNSVATSFVIDAAELSANVTVTPPAQYQVSLSNTFTNVGTSTNPLTVTATDGIIDNTTVFVRFAPAIAGTFNGNVAISTSGYTTVNLLVFGTAAGVLSIADELGISIYPNPTQGSLKVANESGQPIRLELYTIEGARMTLKQTGDGYDVSALAGGMYVVVVKDAQNKTLFSQRIIKE